MKNKIIYFLLAGLLVSCGASQLSTTGNSVYGNKDTLITQSLFADKNSNISEDNIQKILAGKYLLPPNLRIAIIKIENNTKKNNYYYYNNYHTDEGYLRNQQAYIDLLTKYLKQTSRVERVSLIPDMLLSKPETYTTIREAAVRMQADIVIIYFISSDIYTKFKFLSKDDIKAFATTQLIMLDVRTGLVPFTAISTKDFMSQKKTEDMDNTDTKNRIQHEAILLTINEIGTKIVDFINKN